MLATALGGFGIRVVSFLTISVMAETPYKAKLLETKFEKVGTRVQLLAAAFSTEKGKEG